MNKEKIDKLLSNKLKQMKYQTERKVEILCEGTYMGYQFYILNLGTHPTAYIEIPKESKLFEKDYDEIYDMGIDIDVHGGLTYSDNHLQDIKENTWFIGWDYAHAGDYCGYEELMTEHMRLGRKKWTTEEILEDVANVIEQIDLLLEQEAFKNCKVRIMPDVHAGAGCVIGFTGNLGDKVIPNIVGVDIGCGMLCVGLGDIDLDLEELDKVIRENIPSGMNVHNEIPIPTFFLGHLKCYKELKNKDNWLEKSMGTLGGGNHFIEVDVDENNNKYLVIHTGSRNLGKQVAEIYQNKAIEYCSYKKEMAEEKMATILYLKNEEREKEIQEKLKEITKKYEGKTKLPKDLCYLEDELMEDYLHDMEICQQFATINRETIAGEIIAQMGLMLCVEEYFHTVHNYISFEDNIVRKGAISAKKGERVLIPMNMRDGCIIAIGKGNEDWNYSAPHGAGRIMSRMVAKKTFTMEEYKENMKDIYTTSVNEDTLDEAPMVYKSMQEIIGYIGDTVEIERIIKPIYNFKSSE